MLLCTSSGDGLANTEHSFASQHLLMLIINHNGTGRTKQFKGSLIPFFLLFSFLPSIPHFRNFGTIAQEDFFANLSDLRMIQLQHRSTVAEYKSEQMLIFVSSWGGGAFQQIPSSVMQNSIFNITDFLYVYCRHTVTWMVQASPLLPDLRS